MGHWQCCVERVQSAHQIWLNEDGTDKSGLVVWSDVRRVGCLETVGQN